MLVLSREYGESIVIKVSDELITIKVVAIKREECSLEIIVPKSFNRCWNNTGSDIKVFLVSPPVYSLVFKVDTMINFNTTDGPVECKLIGIKYNDYKKVRLGFNADRSIPIHRLEVFEKIKSVTIDVDVPR